MKRSFDAQKLAARCFQQTLREFIDLMNGCDDYLCIWNAHFACSNFCLTKMSLPKSRKKIDFELEAVLHTDLIRIFVSGTRRSWSRTWTWRWSCSGPASIKQTRYDYFIGSSIFSENNETVKLWMARLSLECQNSSNSSFYLLKRRFFDRFSFQ